MNKCPVCNKELKYQGIKQVHGTMYDGWVKQPYLYVYGCGCREPFTSSEPPRDLLDENGG